MAAACSLVHVIVFQTAFSWAPLTPVSLPPSSASLLTLFIYQDPLICRVDRPYLLTFLYHGSCAQIYVRFYAVLLNEGHFVADSWLGLHVSGALPTSNGTMQYLQLTEVAQIVHLLQDDAWMPRWDALLCRSWQICHWQPVLFTDERRFQLSTCDRPERVCRRCCLEHPGLAVVHWWSGKVYLCRSLQDILQISRCYSEVPNLLLGNRMGFFLGPLPGHRVVQWVTCTSHCVNVWPLSWWRGLSTCL